MSLSQGRCKILNACEKLNTRIIAYRSTFLRPNVCEKFTSFCQVLKKLHKKENWFFFLPQGVYRISKNENCSLYGDGDFAVFSAVDKTGFLTCTQSWQSSWTFFSQPSWLTSGRPGTDIHTHTHAHLTDCSTYACKVTGSKTRWRQVVNFRGGASEKELTRIQTWLSYLLMPACPAVHQNRRLDYCHNVTKVRIRERRDMN